MTTWNGASPPVLPPPSLAGRFIGVLRMSAFLVMTAVALVIFVTGRYLRAGLGNWITFHFLTARLWSRAGLWLLGLCLVVRGTPVASGALVSNHCSWADILTLRSVKLMYFVAKSEVRDWPAVGLITVVTGTIFIERKRNQAKRQEQVLRERIAAEQLLIFFPEGTSTDGLRVLPFKSSLFSAFFYDHHAADLWVQPVTVRYIPAPGSGLPPGFYGWWGDMSLGSHVWAVMSRSFGGRAEVIFHEPVKPQAFGNRKALAQHCGAVVARGLTEA
jgi:1-acyl-sn-glycerol-3-phosphate acyltransferase